MKLDMTFKESNQSFDMQFDEGSQEFSSQFGSTTIVHDGQNGATFIPYVSPEGIISWTNNRELENPEPVNIKGKDGSDATVTSENIKSALGYEPANKEELTTLSDNISVIFYTETGKEHSWDGGEWSLNFDISMPLIIGETYIVTIAGEEQIVVASEEKLGDISCVKLSNNNGWMICYGKELAETHEGHATAYYPAICEEDEEDPSFGVWIPHSVKIAIQKTMMNSLAGAVDLLSVGLNGLTDKADELVDKVDELSAEADELVDKVDRFSEIADSIPEEIEELMTSMKKEILVDVEEKVEEFSIQSDWEQTDASKSDYIKNKPFGEIVEKTVVYDEVTINLKWDEMEERYYTTLSSKGWNPIVGEEYTLVIDDTEYKCNSHDEDDIIFIYESGKALYESAVVIWFIPEEQETFTLFSNEGGEHTFSIIIPQVSSKKIDKKYLPNTIDLEVTYEDGTTATLVMYGEVK